MPLRLRRQPKAEILTPAAAVAWLRGSPNWTDEPVNENSTLSLSAFWRAGMLIGSTIGGLPLKTYRDVTGGERVREKSFLDNPGGPTTSYLDDWQSITPFEWKETNALHLFLQGEAPNLHIYDQGNRLVGLQPIHPLALDIQPNPDGHTSEYPDGRIYKVSVTTATHGRSAGGGTGQVTMSCRDITVFYGPVSNGLRGMSFLSFGRNSIGIGLAGEKAAGTMFRNGANLGGAFVPGADQSLDEDDIRELRKSLNAELFGANHAGNIPIINRVLTFMPWQMTNLDAQFLESRQFQIEEAARWTGVPPHLLMALEKTTSWGTGIAEQNKNLAQYVLLGYTQRMEQRLSRLLPSPRFPEFDMAGLEAGSAKDEIDLLLRQVNGGFLTVNEGRRIRNLLPVDGGDELRVPSGVMLQPQLQAAAEAASVGVPTDQTTGEPA